MKTSTKSKQHSYIYMLFLFTWLFIKRLISKKSFWIILILLPLFALLLRANTSDASIHYRVGLYSDDIGVYGTKICEQLRKSNMSMTFELAPSKQALLDDVTAMEYDCAFYFPEDFSNHMESLDLTETVDVYHYSRNTSFQNLAMEYVYSEIFTQFVYCKMTDYILSREYYSFSDDARATLKQQIEAMYTNYLNSEETFHLEMRTSSHTSIRSDQIVSQYLLNSVSGIVSLFIMFGTMAGTIYLYQDKQKHLFLSLPSYVRMLSQFAELVAAAILTAVSGYLTLYVCNEYTSLATLFARLLIYCILCSIYCYILHMLIPNTHIFIIAILLITLGSLITCPIFMDFGFVFPPVKYIKWMFIPAYY